MSKSTYPLKLPTSVKKAAPDRHLRERTDRDAWKINEFVLQRKNRSAVLCKSCA